MINIFFLTNYVLYKTKQKTHLKSTISHFINYLKTSLKAKIKQSIGSFLYLIRYASWNCWNLTNYFIDVFSAIEFCVILKKHTHRMHNYRQGYNEPCVLLICFQFAWLEKLNLINLQSLALVFLSPKSMFQAVIFHLMARISRFQCAVNIDEEKNEMIA